MIIGRLVVKGIGIALALVTFASTLQAEEPQYVSLPDQYIVTFRDDLSRKEILQLTRQLTASHGLRLRHTFRDSIRGFSGIFPAGKVEILRRHPAVLSIEQNGFWFIEDASARIATVDAPTNLLALPTGGSQIDLTWTDNATTERGFEVFRSTNGINGAYSRLAR